MFPFGQQQTVTPWHDFSERCIQKGFLSGFPDLFCVSVWDNKWKEICKTLLCFGHPVIQLESPLVPIGTLYSVALRVKLKWWDEGPMNLRFPRGLTGWLNDVFNQCCHFLHTLTILEDIMISSPPIQTKCTYHWISLWSSIQNHTIDIHCTLYIFTCYFSRKGWHKSRV